VSCTVALPQCYYCRLLLLLLPPNGAACRRYSSLGFVNVAAANVAAADVGAAGRLLQLQG